MSYPSSAGLPPPSFVSIVRAEVSQDADFRDGARLVVPSAGGPYAVTVDGQPVMCAARDLTGKQLEGVIAPSYDFSSVIDTLAAADIPIIDPLGGFLRFAIPQARVATWPAGAWVFVVRERTLADGSLKDVMRGPFLVFPRRF